VAAFALAIAMVAITFAIRAIGGGGSQPAPETPPQPIEPKAKGLIYFQLGGGDGGTWTDAIQPDGSICLAGLATRRRDFRLDAERARSPRSRLHEGCAVNPKGRAIRDPER
jgi:hypothetical protein